MVHLGMTGFFEVGITGDGCGYHLCPFFHFPPSLITCVLSAVVGKRSLGSPGNIYLFDLTSLRTLKLRTSVPGYSLFQGLPCDILQLLSTQSHLPTTIGTICLGFYFTNVLDDDDLQHPESIPERPGIDTVLGRNLRLKTVKVRYLFRSRDYWRWLVAQPPEALARLHEAVHRVFPQISASEGIKS